MKNRFQKIAAALVSIFPEIVAIYAYGSQVSGNVHKGSDLDLALLFQANKSPNLQEVYHHLGRMAEVAQCPVDIGVLSHANNIYAKEVIANGKRVYCCDAKQCDEFEMYCLSYYAQLNAERSEIITSYQKREENG